MESRRILLSTIDDEVALEKGRLLAAKAIAENPEQRRTVEDRLGREYCERRWPEAYRSKPFFRNIIDKIKHIRL